MSVMSATEHIRSWVQEIIVKHAICPFAKREVERNTIRYQECDAESAADILEQLVLECMVLDRHPETETTIIILTKGFADFHQYLQLVETAEDLIVEYDYEGIYQIASFHPDYCFAGEPADDPANFTNRAPYPLLHILREGSVEKALQHYQEPESIPERNIEFARSKGNDFWLAALAQLKSSHDTK
ncbi:DUF1415 domain-containing protein [Pseudidiomarina aestuarii]|uniref:DUF1415 domain-containing protein n=2 Tax=Pseudidiomarina aestuarii TaxID=624146 RepID=A0A2T4D4L8_9GAMM|nr:DUF1415 domain-containing protein [Pseudidiomarina aestuarii]PTB88761.1 DUF1415 domain-containing protein [Pseudidiomarina aestuarii]